MKPRADVTRSPKQGYQWPHKRTYVLQNLFKKIDIGIKDKIKFEWNFWEHFGTPLVSLIVLRTEVTLLFFQPILATSVQGEI